MNPTMNKCLRKVLVILAVVVAASLANAQNPTEPPRPGGQPDRPAGPRRGMGGGGRGVEFAASPQGKDEVEKKVLDVLDEMAQRQRGMMSVPRDDGRLLRLLVESIGAKNVVEVGTSHGYSAIWMALGLRKTGGKLACHEIDQERAALARENFKRAGVESTITLVEGDAHVEVTKIKDAIDLLFLDADKEGYIDYLNKLLPLVRPGGLVVAHNVTRGQADPRFVDAITTNAALDTVFLNAGSGGISVTLKKR